MPVRTQLAETIVRTFQQTYSLLGPAAPEQLHLVALAEELRALGLQVARQVPLSPADPSHSVDGRFVDMVVEDSVIVELKFSDHQSEPPYLLVDYVKSTDHRAAVVLNVRPRPEPQSPEWIRRN